MCGKHPDSTETSVIFYNADDFVRPFVKHPSPVKMALAIIALKKYEALNKHVGLMEDILEEAKHHFDRPLYSANLLHFEKIKTEFNSMNSLSYSIVRGVLIVKKEITKPLSS